TPSLIYKVLLPANGVYKNNRILCILFFPVLTIFYNFKEADYTFKQSPLDWYIENCKNEEILNSLKYVRPGNGFEPGFTVFQKCEVNGKGTHPVFAYLKDKLPAPEDDPATLFTEPRYIVWSPVHRSDISWNFEKFLVGPEGEAFKRYSKSFHTINIEPDIQRLLKLAK
uniref:glutathione peroxidase n=1 Tax=Leptobrachium leishanense TaxID=445787 RepID=A0A8C5MXF8_9ANUR